MTRLLIATLALLTTACGADPVRHRLSRSEADAIRDRSAQATDGDPEMGGHRAPRRAAREQPPADPPPQQSAPPEITELPAAPPGSLVGDGFGPTQREAVLDARRVISEQIIARMTSDVSTQTEERNGQLDKSSRLKVRTQSAFDHVELIKSLGVVRRGPHDFVARAILPKRATARVYADEMSATYQRLERLGPVVARAISEEDTSVLLRADRAPAYLLGEQRRRGAIIRLLGERPPAMAPKTTARVAKRASAARSKAVIRLKTEGNVHPTVARGVLAEVEKLMAIRGCHMVTGPAATDGPVADATLRIHARPHQEAGLEWTYIGLELSIVDARNGKSVFSWAGMPQIAHGGGPDRARADVAAVRRLSERLPAKAGKAFQGLYCR